MSPHHRCVRSGAASYGAQTSADVTRPTGAVRTSGHSPAKESEVDVLYYAMRFVHNGGKLPVQELPQEAAQMCELPVYESEPVDGYAPQALEDYEF